MPPAREEEGAGFAYREEGKRDEIYVILLSPLTDDSMELDPAKLKVMLAKGEVDARAVVGQAAR